MPLDSLVDEDVYATPLVKSLLDNLASFEHVVVVGNGPAPGLVIDFFDGLVGSLLAKIVDANIGAS